MYVQLPRIMENVHSGSNAIGLYPSIDLCAVRLAPYSARISQTFVAPPCAARCRHVFFADGVEKFKTSFWWEMPASRSVRTTLGALRDQHARFAATMSGGGLGKSGSITVKISFSTGFVDNSTTNCPSKHDGSAWMCRQISETSLEITAGYILDAAGFRTWFISPSPTKKRSSGTNSGRTACTNATISKSCRRDFLV